MHIHFQKDPVYQMVLVAWGITLAFNTASNPIFLRTRSMAFAAASILSSSRVTNNPVWPLSGSRLPATSEMRERATLRKYNRLKRSCAVSCSRINAAVGSGSLAVRWAVLLSEKRTLHVRERAQLLRTRRRMASSSAIYRILTRIDALSLVLRSNVFDTSQTAFFRSCAAGSMSLPLTM